MGIIIGAGTIVNFANTGACVTSANWGYNPNTQRFYCLGSWSPRYTFNKPTETLSISIYSGTGSILHSFEPHQECRVAGDPRDTIFASVDAAGCGGGVTSVTGQWYVNSYSFQKDDPQLPGTESWSLQRWVAYGNPGDTDYTPAPTYIIRGISEGQSTPQNDPLYGDEYAGTGIRFTGATAQSTTGSISAGQTGRAEVMLYGVVDRVGGSDSTTGRFGNGSASAPYTPMWI
jgi:hypothetical protein